MKQILNKIKRYDTIIIHRHKNPDMDALGSQIGLKQFIKYNYPNKEVYIVGEMNQYKFLGDMDIIDDSKYQNALVIIVDVCVKSLISDDRYEKAKEVIVIDHHTNIPDIKYDYKLIDSNYKACAEIITDMIMKSKLKINKDISTSLMTGIITDSGRFLYIEDRYNLFKVSEFLLKNKAKMDFIYNNLYLEDLESKKIKNYFSSLIKFTKNNVGYLINDQDILDKLNLDPNYVSRGLVNLMSGIKNVNIWVNFTYFKNLDKYIAEFRSRDVSVLDIAKEYGGGGHVLACGATLDNKEVVLEVLNKLDQRLGEFNGKRNN